MSRRICALRSEEHTSELQSSHLVCRLLLEKKTKRRISCTAKADTLTAHRTTERSVAGRQNGFRCKRSLAPGGGRGSAMRLSLLFFLNETAPPEFYPFPPRAPLPI